MSDDEPTDREVIVPEPPPGSPWRRAIPIVGVAWIVLHLLIPQRYYRGGDEYDERFAWRMFSSVRVRECQVHVTERPEGGEAREIRLMQALPAPWVALLDRNRRAVIDRVLESRCEREGIVSAVFSSRCVDARGNALEPTELVMRCEDRRILGRDE